MTGDRISIVLITDKFIFVFVWSVDNNNLNKFAQSDLGRGPRRCESKSPLDTMARPKFAQKYPFPWTDPKPHHLTHPWTRPTYDTKRHPDPICRFSTMHWTDRRNDRRTDQPTDRPRESSMTIGRYASNENIKSTYFHDFNEECESIHWGLSTILHLYNAPNYTKFGRLNNCVWGLDNYVHCVPVKHVATSLTLIWTKIVRL